MAVGRTSVSRISIIRGEVRRAWIFLYLFCFMFFSFYLSCLFVIRYHNDSST